ncbi:alpha/beta hydrolase [Aminobacter sp. MSH1]|uniref:alpha/beta fold hydrolase n=1 Tax=Aminobacter sp. MSH1 TaxID=374606 RepID=UPI000D3812E2|nr:alpha/beta hydrolase [Aminobacter sp. MSH1]
MTECAIRHHTAQVESVRLHYVTAGAGEPLVLLHGWPQTWWEWRRIIPALSERYLVIAPDLRGLGDSSCPLAGFDKRTVASDIFKLVHDQLGHSTFHLVGHDWGGVVAYALTHAHQACVRRLSIIDVVVPIGSPDELTWNGRRWHHTFHWQRDLPEALVTGRERAYLSWFYKNLAFNASAITEEDLLEYVRAYSQPGVLRSGFEYYRATHQDIENFNESMKVKLAMPVLAIGGENSRKTQVAENLKLLADDVRECIIDRCGHWVPEEQPEALARALLEFFAESS